MSLALRSASGPIVAEYPKIAKIHLVVSVQVSRQTALLLLPRAAQDTQVQEIHSAIIVQIPYRQIEQIDIVEEHIGCGASQIEEQVGGEIRGLGHGKYIT